MCGILFPIPQLHLTPNLTLKNSLKLAALKFECQLISQGSLNCKVSIIHIVLKVFFLCIHQKISFIAFSACCMACWPSYVYQDSFYNSLLIIFHVHSGVFRVKRERETEIIRMQTEWGEQVISR